MLFLLTVVFLYPAVLGGKALLPADYLAAMRPWRSVLSTEQQAASGDLADSAIRIPQWNPLLWDGIAQFYPWRVHYSRSMASGVVPLWNPHQFCGAPFAANGQTAVFYPINLLFVLFSPVRAFGLSAALHLFLAGAFTFLLARALGMGRFGATVAGVVFEFSAFLVVWIELPTFVNVAVWLPLALYLILKAADEADFVYAIFAGFVLGLSILAGHFQIASYVLGAAALWWIWLIGARVRTEGHLAVRRGALLAALSFGAAFLIAAPQILPTLELAGLSHRVREVSAEGYGKYVANAIPGRNLITLFVPNFYGNPSLSSYWAGSAADFMERALYVGVLPLALGIVGAVFGIRRRGAGFFVALALVSLLLAFGTAINSLTYYLLPGSSALGGPNRVILLFCFCAAMLAGFGAHWFLQHAQKEYATTGRKLGWRALAVGSAIFAVIFLAAQFVAAGSLSRLGIEPAKAAAAAWGQYLSLGAVLLAGLGVLAAYTVGHIPKPLFGTLALAVVVGDLFGFGIGFNPTTSVDRVYPETRLTKWLQKNAGTDRLMPINENWSLDEQPDAILPPNAATVYGLYDMQGYDSLFPKRYKDFVDGRLGMDSSPRENGNILFVRSGVADWPQGTAAYVITKEVLDDPSLALVFQSDGGYVYRRRDQPGYQRVYLLPLAERPSQKLAPRAWPVRCTPNRVVVRANTDRVSRLVLADAYYPGWRADVDGRETPVSVAQGIFRSVLLEPGNHTVTFQYRPGTFVVGMFLGLVGAAVVGAAGGGVVARRRRR